MQSIFLIVIAILPFFAIQLDIRISYVIYFLALLLLPTFVIEIKKKLAQKDPVTFFFLAFLLFSVLSTLFSIDKLLSVHQLFLFISYFVIFTCSPILFPHFKSKEKLGYVLIGVTTLLSAISLYYTLILRFVNQAPIGVSFFWVYFGHNHLADLLLFTIPLTLYFLIINWSHRALRMLFTFTFSLLAIALFFTFARGAVVSLSIAAFVSLILFAKSKQYQLPMLLLIGLAILLIELLPVFSGFRLQKISLVRQLDGSRMTYWENAIENAKSHPFFGTGLDTFRIINETSSTKPRTGSDYAHNFFLQMLSDTGVAGFIASVTLVITALWTFFKSLTHVRDAQKKLFYGMLFAGLLASTMNSLVDFDWHLPFVFLVYWIIMALIPTP